jgi:hypothetical protein
MEESKDTQGTTVVLNVPNGDKEEGENNRAGRVGMSGGAVAPNRFLDTVARRVRAARA